MAAALVGGWAAFEAGRAARAATRSADVAAQNLAGVERPILFVSVEGGILKSLNPDGQERPAFTVRVENSGKQIASITSSHSSFVVQPESKPPEPTAIGANDGSSCPIFFIGEVPIRPGCPPTRFWCQRQDALSERQIAGLRDGSLYGFLRVSFVYTDPVGTMRLTVAIFVYLPQVGSLNEEFAHVLTHERTLDKIKNDTEHAELKRKKLAATLPIAMAVRRRTGGPAKTD